MEYAAMTCWLVVIVFSALAVHRIWTNMAPPKVVNAILLPGTLVAQLGHVVGLLVTGGTVTDTTLIKDDDSGEPQTGGDGKSRIPVVGPVVIAMLPMLACGLAIYIVSQYMGQDIRGRMSQEVIPRILPTTLPAFWQMLRDGITLVEQLVEAIRDSNFSDWHTWAFLYLVVCLTVRMAPLPGTLRGAIGAIIVLGLATALLGMLLTTKGPGPTALDRAWPLITFSTAMLLLLLLVSLCVRGGVDLAKILFGQSKKA